MEKQWYDLGYFEREGNDFVDALNGLAKAGITPENIKTSENWIYFFHHEHIDIFMDPDESDD